ncbi:MAG: hypothetical protein IJ011_08325 [Clostridia bacterium]|nr:hypothetical protein [Clostridia bacterium]
MKKLFAIVLTVVMLISSLSIMTLSVNAIESSGTENENGSVSVQLTTTADGWDGTTATKPAGEGTESNPYLISSAENLYWLSQQVGTGKTVFENVVEGYFKQTCDIDLNGRNFVSIGYFANADASWVVAFGGNYNGQGYSVKNGNIVTANEEYDYLVDWATGLFGVICDATVENVVLDNVHVQGEIVAGGIVGASCSKDFAVGNTIRNCVVKSTCTVTATRVTSEDIAKDAAGVSQAMADKSTSYNTSRTPRAGGIVGLGGDVVIENCINEALVKNGNGASQGNIGGIAGQLAGGATVTNCINKGNLAIDFTGCATTTSRDPNAHHNTGGIVGMVTSWNANGAPQALVDAPITISNCYNDGHIVALANGYDADNPLILRKKDQGAGSSHNRHMWAFGGILGSSKNTTQTVTITNCYNLDGTKELDPIVLKNGNNGEDICGLIGTVNTEQGSKTGVVGYISNSYSVAMENLKLTAADQDWPRTNECAWTNWGKLLPSLIMTDVATKTEAEIKVYTDAIDTLVAQNLAKGRA